MKIVTFNLNGLRAADQKGLSEWIRIHDADIYCFQEIKMDASLHDTARALFPSYHAYFYSAQKKGYSGVGILSKHKPKEVTYGCGHDLYDAEGRNLWLHFDEFSLLNTYYPSGSQGEERQKIKEDFLAYMLPYLQNALEKYPKLVHVGDFNICHQEIDIHHPEKHHKVSGFLPHERAWFSSMLNLGLVDSLRVVNPNPDQYTWWSYRSGARAKNLGWRIDYQLVSEGLKDRIQDHRILSEIVMSDHCPTELHLSI
jgi:exodeoxyribonuclease-3